MGSAALDAPPRASADPTMTRALFLGIAVQDFVFALDAIPTTPEKHRARDLAVVGGGLAANAAVSAARLGAEAMLITRLGDDMVGRAIRSEIEGHGVDCSLTRAFPGRRSSLSAILVDRAGERLVVNYADPDLPTGTDWLPRMLPAGTRAVMADIRWLEGAHHVFALARAAGVPAVLDLDRDIADHALAAAASHVAMSMQALRGMAGTEDPVAGLARFRAIAPGWLAVTDGARGCWFTEGSTIAHEPAFAVDVVDTLGAGDAFHGALTLALGEGRPPRESVRFASAVAALKCTRFGGRAGTPSRAETDAFLASNPEVHR